MVGGFVSLVKAAARKVKSLPDGSFVRVISHYDADGLSSGLIVSSALTRASVNFGLRFVRQMDDAVVEEINRESADLVILADLGSSFEGTEMIEPDLIILDHHSPLEFRKQNLIYANPMFFGIEEASASTVAYMFARFLSGVSLEDISLIGMKGDQREIAGFNLEIVSRGMNNGRIGKERTLDIFGLRTKPLHKALSSTYDPYLPGISGDESGAVQFLQDIGIDIRGGSATFLDLTEKERRHLISSLVVRRAEAGMENPEEVLRDVYIIRGYSATELSTIFNSIGRLEKFHILFEWFVNGNEEIISDVMREYRRMISEYLAVAESRLEGDEIAVLDASDEINQNFIGTVVSILKHMKGIRTIVGFGDAGEYAKISVRSDGDVLDILERTVSPFGVYGGHSDAGGGYIKKSDVPKVIERLRAIRLQGRVS